MHAGPEDHVLLAVAQEAPRGHAEGRPASEDRLLLRLSDRQRPEDAERQPRGSTPRSARSRSTRRPATRSTAASSRPCTGRRRCRPCSARAEPPPTGPRAYNDVRDAWRTYLRKYNKGRGVVLDQPLPGHLHAARSWWRRRSTRSRRPPQARVGAPARRQRDGQEGQGRGRRLQARARLPLQAPDRLRGGVLDLQRTRPPRERHLRPHQHGRPGGAVHQPGGPRRRLALGSTSIYPSAPFAPAPRSPRPSRSSASTQPSPPTTWAELRGAYTGRCSSAGGADVLLIDGPRGRADVHALAGPHLGPAPDRREHRAREPGGPGARPGRPPT